MPKRSLSPDDVIENYKRIKNDVGTPGADPLKTFDMLKANAKIFFKHLQPQAKYLKNTCNHEAAKLLCTFCEEHFCVDCLHLCKYCSNSFCEKCCLPIYEDVTVWKCYNC